MFSWFISLFLLFTNHGNAQAVTSVGVRTTGSVNPHVQPADSQQPSATSPAETDGQGGGTG